MVDVAMLLAVVILQVAATAVHGIITQRFNESVPVKLEEVRPHLIKFEEPKVASRHTRKINGSPTKIQNWKSILRDATFQSLIKHTGFTPSLEEKMESDRLLWEKLQAAKFLRKSTGKGEDPNEKLKMGVLVDMTADGGSLEFRQSDKSVYTCPDRKCEQVLRRLLAIWKVQRFEPNDTWIRIKVPRHKQDEDVYEYTPKHGLQQMNTRFSKTTNSPTANTSSTTTTTTTDNMGSQEVSANKESDDEEMMPVLDERVSKIERRMDLGKGTIYEVKRPRAKDYVVNIGKIETSGKFDTHTIPQTLSQKIQFAPHNKPRQNLFFQIETVEPKIIKEFQHVKGGFYNGFMPSLGPTGSPFTTIDYSRHFAETFPKFTEYATEIHHSKGNLEKINFRPSKKFVQYSEPDPIYHGDPTPKLDPLRMGSLSFSKITNDSRMNDVTTTLQPNMEDSTATTKLASELEHEEQTDSSINVSRFADTKGNEIHATTKTPPRRVHNRPKTGLTSIIRDSSGEVRDYAPLYAKWGEKIKTTQKPRIATIPMTTTMTLEPPKIFKPTTSYVRATEPAMTTELSTAPNMSPKSTELLRNTTRNSTNMIVDNMENKTPEEIVNALTNLGVQNSTRVEGYPLVSEKTLENSSKILEKLNRETKFHVTNPVSLIVNRISQSYSYRTASGSVARFRKMRRRLGHR